MSNEMQNFMRGEQNKAVIMEALKDMEGPYYNWTCKLSEEQRQTIAENAINTLYRIYEAEDIADVGYEIVNYLILYGIAIYTDFPLKITSPYGEIEDE
jgi:hypothetical protein